MKLERLEHVGVVVRNLETSVVFFRDVLGLRLGEVEYLDAHKIRIALMPLGETMVELIEDQDAHGPYSRFIAEKGEGVHHLCFEVRDIDAALEELRRAGANLHNEEPVRGHQNCRILFFNPPGNREMLIELSERNGSVEGKNQSDP